MGGCASRPKGAEFTSDEAPQPPVSPTKSQAEVQPEAPAPENNTDGAESEKKDEPLVDLSEAKEKEKEPEKAPATAESEEPAKEEPQKDEKPVDEPLVTV